jgi:peptide-methionine (S)-S-oxide reductase
MSSLESENNIMPEIATLAGGCFWCLEAVYVELRGVSKVVSGYMGGATANPSYEAVCSGTTGHAEVVQVHFDPAVITYRDVLEVFFSIHDPTTLNQQGNDRGTQYRSAIYYHSPAQEQEARTVVAELASDFDNDIVTEITAASTFYRAEDYHQNYFANNPNQPYCMFVVNPKVKKFRAKFAQMKKA